MKPQKIYQWVRIPTYVKDSVGNTKLMYWLTVYEDKPINKEIINKYGIGVSTELPKWRDKFMTVIRDLPGDE